MLLKNQEITKVLLTVAFARLIKEETHRSMRSKMFEVSVPSDEPFNQIVVEEMNIILGNHEKSEEFWKLSSKELFLKKYGTGLKVNEIDRSYDLRESLDVPLLISVILSSLKIKLRHIAKRELKHDWKTYSFVENDIKAIQSRSKSVYFIYFSEAMFLYIKSKSVQMGARRLLETSNKLFEFCSVIAPMCPITSFRWGDCTADLSKHFEEGKEKILEQAFCQYEKSVILWNKCLPGYQGMVWTLNEHAEYLKKTQSNTEKITELLALSEKYNAILQSLKNENEKKP